MKIAILGAGFTGLSAAYDLVKKGHDVYIFEKENFLGGLASGFKEKDWKWSIENHYHHLFTNDIAVKNLAEEINQQLITLRPKTSSLINGKTYQLDSPLTLINFPLLSLIKRLRMGMSLALLRYNPFWKPLEKVKANKLLPLLMGKQGYQLIWQPLFENKFKNYKKDISLAWFWARVKKRTTSLVYPVGGFLEFENSLYKIIKKLNGHFFFKSKIIKIKNNDEKTIIEVLNNKNKKKVFIFDKIIVTSSTLEFLKTTDNLSKTYKNNLNKLKSIGAISLIIRFKKSFLTDGTYWLNICSKKSPVMAIVEHTNFINKKNYNNENIVYIGNYFPVDSLYFSKNKKELLAVFDPFLKKINKDYKKDIIDIKLFKSNYAQPIVFTNYSKIIPDIKTPHKNIFLANMDQVYPWDRGVNYAVELGQKVAKICCE